MQRIAKVLSAASVLMAILLPVTVHAADSAKGKVLARQCSVCHGKMGIAKDPEVPNLAGQSSFYLEKALNDFRTGTRQDRRMSLLVQGLRKSDIKDLAAWYASVAVTVIAPE